MIRDYWESFREFIAFKIYPELNLYIQVAKTIGELNENDKIIERIEQSSLRNKKAVIDLVKAKRYTTEEVIRSLDGAFEGRTSSDAS
jgi:hypothetical protein